MHLRLIAGATVLSDSVRTTSGPSYRQHLLGSFYLRCTIQPSSGDVPIGIYLIVPLSRIVALLFQISPSASKRTSLASFQTIIVLPVRRRLRSLYQNGHFLDKLKFELHVTIDVVMTRGIRIVHKG